MGQCHIENEGPGAPVSAPLNVGSHWVDTTTGLHYLSIGTSSVNDWVLINKQDTVIEASVGASSSADVDTIPMSNLCTVKYIVCVSNATEDKWRSFEMLGGKKSSTEVEDTLYSLLGSVLDVDFDFDVSAGDAKLTVTNNETFDVDIKIHKNLI